MRKITASEVKPGMTIRWWDSDGNSYQIKVDDVAPSINPNFVILDGTDGSQIRLGEIPQITVLSEPAPPQPEEPTELGVKVIVDGRRAVHARPTLIKAWELEREGGDTMPCTWSYLCSLGHVTVVPDQGWTVPDTPEVPERIEEWDTWEDVPEGVVVGNPELNYQYRKASGKIEAISPISGGVWGETSLPLWTYPGPWERVSDA